MTRRGHALALVLAVLAVLGIGGTVVTSLVSMDLHTRHDDDVRVQALWLARSAMDTATVGLYQVDTQYGQATVHAHGRTVTVELAGARATVTRDPWREEYTGS